MPSRSFCRPVVLALLLTAGPAAQVPDTPRTGGRGVTDDRELVIPAGVHAVTALVADVERQLDIDVLFADAEVPAGIEIRLTRKLEARGDVAVDLFSQLLFSCQFGLALVDRERRLYRMVHLQGPHAQLWLALADHQPVEEVLRRRRSMLPALTSMQLQHAEAQSTMNALRVVMQSHTGNMFTMAAIASSNSIVLRGPHAWVAAAIETLRRVDLEPPKKG